METFEFSCDMCGRKLQAPRSDAGRRMVCPGCNGMVVVPDRERPRVTPPAVPARSGPGAGRVCPRCGRTVAVEAHQAGQTVRCTGCWATLAPDGTPLVEEMQYEERPNRWAKVAGWVTSVVLHGALLLVFAFITWMPRRGGGGGGEGPEVGIVPGTAPIGTGPSTPVQVQPPSAPPSAVATGVSEQAMDIKTPVTAANADTVIGIESGGGSTDSAGFESIAAGGGAAGGSATFFGLGARGRKFVFVVDRSGSMGDVIHGVLKLRAAIAELTRSVNALGGNLQFYIIFYNGAFMPMPSRSMVAATRENKQRYLRWTEDIRPDDGTEPTGAMKLALSFKPSAIWLLSDGLFDESAAAVIRQNNPGQRVQIHTIAFFENDGEHVLQMIAEQNRGKYRFVKPQDAGAVVGGDAPPVP